MPALTRPTEPVNEELKRHVSHPECLSDWKHADLVQRLHMWAGRFSTELFKIELPTPAIQVEKIRRGALGTFRHGRNGFGLRDEITINIRFLGGQPFVELLATLAHEQLHQWQSRVGKPSHARGGSYHNKEFRAKAKELGLIVDEAGHQRVESGRFTALLSQYGQDVSELLGNQSPLAHRRQGFSKLKKWSCRCTNVRVAIEEFHARCLKCEVVFRRAD